MPPANASTRYQPHGRADRRLGTGVAVSVLLHALLLSLQFGAPGLDLGSGGPIAVSLAPALPPLSSPASPPVPPKEAPSAPPVLHPSPVPAPAPPRSLGGLRLVDPVAPVPAEPAAVRPKVKSASRTRLVKRTRPPAPKRRVAPVSTPLIAAAPRAGSDFSVPLPEIEAAPDILAAHAAAGPEAAGDTPEPVPAPDSPAPALAAEQAADQAQVEALRLAEDQEQRQAQERQAQLEEAQRQAARIVEEEERRAQQLAELQREEQRLAERRAAEESERLAQENAAQWRQREQEELARQAERRMAEEAAAREAQALARARAEEEQRRLADQLAQRQREDAQRLAQEQVERQRAEAAQRRMLEERSRQQAAERAEAERLARQAAEESARRLAAERGRAQEAAPGLDGQGASAADAGPGAGAGAGAGGGGRMPGGALAGALGGRARELLRGVTIPSVAPPVAAVMVPNGRRVVADGAERDVPLRLYVDSVRQKLERNAVLGGARFALRDVRIDPLVSLSLRSDGSIDDVTIVRSSGRPDMDEAVRRFVRLNARYSAFPPNVAAHFDVIEIRRVWAFADGLKLMEELH